MCVNYYTAKVGTRYYYGYIPKNKSKFENFQRVPSVEYLQILVNSYHCEQMLDTCFGATSNRYNKKKLVHM